MSSISPGHWLRLAGPALVTLAAAWLPPARAAAADGAPAVQLFNTAELATSGMIPRNDVCAFALYQADRNPEVDAYAYVFFRPAVSSDADPEDLGAPTGMEEDGNETATASAGQVDDDFPPKPAEGSFADLGDAAIIQIDGRFVRLAPAAMADDAAPHGGRAQLWTAEDGRLLVALQLDLVTGTGTAPGAVAVPSGYVTIVEGAAPPFWVAVAGGSVCTDPAPPAGGGVR